MTLIFRFIIFVIFLHLEPTHCDAEALLNYRITTEKWGALQTQKNASETTRTLYVSTDCVRIDEQEYSLVYCPKRRTSFFLVHQKSVYWEVQHPFDLTDYAPESERPLLKQQLQVFQTRVDFEKTGERRDFAGLPADSWTVRAKLPFLGRVENYEAWLTPTPPDIDKDLLRDAEKLFYALNPLEAGWMAQILEREGLLVALFGGTETVGGTNSTQVAKRLELLSIQEATPDPTRFEIPEGYAEEVFRTEYVFRVAVPSQKIDAPLERDP